jgi:alpha-beta hydrolase superfamily lysophospholipase
MKALLRKGRKILTILLVMLSVAGLGFSWFIGGQLSAPQNRPVPRPADLPIEPVQFSSLSGTTVHGWLVKPEFPRAVIILQHGVRGHRGGMVSRARFLQAANYAVLLFDFQAHGESLGDRITFGHLESRDTQAAVKFCRQQFPDLPIAIIGQSLGGAAALLAQPPLPVQALIIESAFSTFEEATKNRMEWLTGRPTRVFSPLLTVQLRLRVGISAADLRPIDHVSQLTMPKLFLAGTTDPRTKLAESLALFEAAAAPKQFYAVTNAGHVDFHGHLKSAYEELILGFLATHLP